MVTVTRCDLCGEMIASTNERDWMHKSGSIIDHLPDPSSTLIYFESDSSKTLLKLLRNDES